MGPLDSNALTAEQFEDFSAVIAGTLGIKMPPAKRVMLQSRLQRRLRELGVESFADYHARFFNDAQHQAVEIEHLLNLATTNKTDFFREPEHFSVLTRETLAHWRSERPSTTFRVWCAGCSTGEEAYTIAMTLLEQQADGAFDFSILARACCESRWMEFMPRSELRQSVRSCGKNTYYAAATLPSGWSASPRKSERACVSVTSTSFLRSTASPK